MNRSGNDFRYWRPKEDDADGNMNRPVRSFGTSRAEGDGATQMFAKPTSVKRGDAGGPGESKTKVPGGPLGRVVEHQLGINPEFWYDAEKCKPFRDAFQEYVSLGGTVEDVMAMMDEVALRMWDRREEIPGWLTFYVSDLRGLSKTLRASLGSPDGTPPPDEPVWKTAARLAKALDAKHGEQVNSELYATEFKRVGIADAVLKEERLIEWVVNRLMRKWPASNRETLTHDFKRWLKPPVVAPPPESTEPFVDPTPDWKARHEHVRARLAEEEPDRFIAAMPTHAAAEPPPEVTDIENLSRQELVDALGDDWAAELSASGLDLSDEELRRWVRQIRVLRV